MSAHDCLRVNLVLHKVGSEVLGFFDILISIGIGASALLRSEDASA
jgi:hypothetical protein